MGLKNRVFGIGKILKLKVIAVEEKND